MQKTELPQQKSMEYYSHPALPLGSWPDEKISVFDPYTYRGPQWHDEQLHRAAWRTLTTPRPTTHTHIKHRRSFVQHFYETCERRKGKSLAQWVHLDCWKNKQQGNSLKCAMGTQVLLSTGWPAVTNSLMSGSWHAQTPPWHWKHPWHGEKRQMERGDSQESHPTKLIWKPPQEQCQRTALC